MDSSGYISITRQSGLLKELQTVANNIANLSTTGFRREGLVFAETVRPLDGEGGGISMATARARFTDDSAGDKTLTGGKLDLAIDGPGFFLLDTPDGQRLTRAGGFSSSGDGFLMTPTGYNVLDSGGAPIFLPPDGGEIGISRDGTISVQGRPIAQVGIYEVEFPEMLQREGGVMFSYDGEPTPAENSTVNKVTLKVQMLTQSLKWHG